MTCGKGRRSEKGEAAKMNYKKQRTMEVWRPYQQPDLNLPWTCELNEFERTANVRPSSQTGQEWVNLAHPR